MNPLQTMRIAIRALRRNKMRSFLTTLGIIIGVSAVIAMVAIGEGAKSQVADTFASMGTNLLIIMPGASSMGGMRGGFGSMPTLTWDDLKAIQNDVSSVRAAAPVLRTGDQVIAEDQNWTTSINGTSPDYFTIRNWKVQKGSLLTKSDVDSGAKVLLIGKTVSDKLFGPTSDPVGQIVRIKKVPFQIVGLLEAKGQSPVGQDYDDEVHIPYTTYLAKIHGGLQNYIAGVIMVSAISPQDTKRAEKQIISLLRDRHRIAVGTDDDFSVRNLTEMAGAMEAGTKTMTTLLACIAAVSLLVGGIGIMNIMLVSVTERTREIGLRMAVGAQPLNILAQFLVEALTLSTTGGIIGAILGVTTARYLSSEFHWPLLISPQIIFIAVAFSALIGVGFGLYPAHKASRLDPIEALRYE